MARARWQALFIAPPARPKDAADAARRPDGVPPLEGAILDVLRARGPLAGEDLAGAVGAHPLSVGHALERMGRSGLAVRCGRMARPDVHGWGGTRWHTLWGPAPDAS